MKKIFTLSAAIIFFVNGSIQAQDIIHFLSGDSVIAKVEEVGVEEIKYKKFSLPEGPVYISLKKEIAFIRYADGSKDIFTEKKNTESASSIPVMKVKAPKNNIFGMFAGLSVPTGSYAAKFEGAAENGFLVGVEGLHIISNSIAYFNYQLYLTVNQYSFDIFVGGVPYKATGNYTIVNGLIGLGVRTSPQEAIFFIEANAGLNSTSLAGTLEQAGYDDAKAFGFSVTTGLVIVQSFKIGVSYFTATPEFENNQSSAFNIVQNVTFLKGTIGYEF